MALEAGEVMHQVFAGVRIWQVQYVQKLPKHALATAHRIYGKERWNAIIEQCSAGIDNEREYLMELAFAILETSGFFDDAKDPVRTLGNMQICSITYIDEMLAKMGDWPIYIEDKKNPKSMVGIEQSFDVVVEFVDGRKIRYIGTIDGLVTKLKHRTSDCLFLDENKTASRLDAAWQMSFKMANQVTGYCGASTCVFGFPVMRARVTGLRIKQGGGEDVMPIEVTRTIHDMFNWAHWLRHTVDLYEMYEDDYENAPRYTHSCNRYFRPCSLLSFCNDTPGGRVEQWKEMVAADPSPSERAIESV